MKIFYIGNVDSLNVKVFIDYLADGHEIHTFGWKDNNYHEKVIHHNINPRQVKRGNQKIRDTSNKSQSKQYFKESLSLNLKQKYESIQIKTLIKEIKPDIVHGHEVARNGIVTSRLRNVPTILTAWGSDINKFPLESKLTFYKVKKSLKKVHAIHVTNPEFGETISNRFDIDPSKINSICWGTDLKLFNRKGLISEQLNEIRSRYDIKDDTVNILYPAGFRDHQLQNYINIVKSFSKIHDLLPIRLVMLSYGRKSGYDEIIKIIKAQKLEKKITIIDEFIPQDHMPYLYSLMDIIMVIHDVDQLAASIHESMLMGCVPILSDIQTYRKSFQEKKNCFYVDQKDPTSIGNMLKYCVNNIDDIKSDILDRNFNLIKENHNRDLQMKKMETFYRSISEKFRSDK